MNGLPLIIMVVALGGMTFFMGRRQKNEQQKRQQVLESMKSGDSVVTIGGLHGVISEINASSNTVVLDCEGIYLEFDRKAIAKVESGAITPQEVPTAAVETEEKTEEEK